MILVDTSVWIDHLRSTDHGLVSLLESGEVLTHPFVIGELACGSLRRRSEILGLLSRLPAAEPADHGEVLAFVDRHRLHAQGIGWIDAHLLASAMLARTKLLTHDRRLARVARTLDLSS